MCSYFAVQQTILNRVSYISGNYTAVPRIYSCIAKEDAEVCVTEFDSTEPCSSWFTTQQHCGFIYRYSTSSSSTRNDNMGIVRNDTTGSPLLVRLFKWLH